MTNKKGLWILCIFLFFVILPSSFALNDENITIDDSLQLESMDFDEDVLTKGNDYYFNASVDEDGIGSKSRPYKYLTTDRIVDGAIIYLADGEYELDNSKTFSSLSIIGESSKNSIIKFTNNDYFFQVNGRFTLQNVTLKAATIMNYGTVNATNTIIAEYKGYSVSNKITVKPVVIAKNISKKKSKKIRFSAKLLNGKGKPFKGKKITFKFKGKTYKVKTNSKGIAKLTLKKLKVGKYKITTKYGKSTIKNTIKIKK